MTGCQEYGVFPRMVEIMLPHGGLVLALLEAYFDESIGVARPAGRQSHRILCVAGYLIDSSQGRPLCEDWRAVLEPRGLEYFHMVDCAHGAGIYSGIPKNERASIAARMIGNIKRRTLHGFAVAVNLEHWDELAPKHPIIGSAYNFCMTVVMNGVSSWVEKQKFGGEIAYFFEAGHGSATETDQLMRKTFSFPEMKQSLKYGGHAFMPKAKCPPVQAADLLAWQFYTDVRRQMEGPKELRREHRKDFGSLLEHPHTVRFILPEMLAALRDDPDFHPATVPIHQAFDQHKWAKRLREALKPAIPSYEGELQS